MDAFTHLSPRISRVSKSAARDALVTRLFNPWEGGPGFGVLDIRLDNAAGPVYAAENSDYEIAMGVAARAYALLTGDFQVTVEDIVVAGLWPYETFAETDMKKSIHNGSSCLSIQHTDSGMYSLIDGGIGSAGWVTSEKADILLYALKGWITECNEGKIDLSRRTEPRRILRFWESPYSGNQMVAGDAPADYSP
jgi:hypothetical protein